MAGVDVADPKRWLLSGDLPCLGCSYNMRGLVGPLVKCPECGRVNDLRDAGAWRQQGLPLGVRQRDHWPATAVMWSLGVVAFGAMTGIMALAGVWPFLPGVIFLATAAMWGWTCRKWLKSVRFGGWGWLVILGVHAGAWAILGGVIVAVIEESWWVLVVVPAGMATLVLMAGVIRRADEAGQFRQDWRSWRVPVDDGGAPTDAA